MSKGQTQTLIIAELNGISAVLTMEEVGAVNIHRRNNAIQNVPGDGRNLVEDIHDPVMIVDEVTLTSNRPENDVFVQAVRDTFEQQMLDPSIAGTLNIYSYLPNGSIVDSIRLMRAVIQGIQTPEGNTGSHALAGTKITVKPLRMTTAG